MAGVEHSDAAEQTSASSEIIDPRMVFDASDPGDETQQNFRYQHLYGVILVVASVGGLRPYVSIWCEHFEDYLCERHDGLFDGYQVKTQKPERGAWRTNDDAFVKSIGRFVDLCGKLAAKAGTFYFVSNTECDHVTVEATDERKRRRCPKLFLHHVFSCSDASEIAVPFISTFDELRAQCGCTSEELFLTLRKVEIVIGPSKREIDATVSNEHLATLPGFEHLGARALNQRRDEIVAAIHRASSLQITAPARHLVGVVGMSGDDPRLTAKRLVPSQVLQSPANQTSPPQFSYIDPPKLSLGSGKNQSVLVQKLKRGDLEDQIDYMASHERAAEYSLMEDIARRPERYPELQTQVEQVVLRACSEAHLRLRSETQTFGPAMLVSVQDALKVASIDRAELIGHHSYECLVGVAALFTSDCRVWWSPRFPVETENQL